MKNYQALDYILDGSTSSGEEIRSHSVDIPTYGILLNRFDDCVFSSDNRPLGSGRGVDSVVN